MGYTPAPDGWWKTLVDASPAHTAKLAELADQYGRRNAVPPEMVVRLTPSSITAKVDIAD
jgi:hypothetical protein